jgi:phage terminase large subunit-like protein
VSAETGLRRFTKAYIQIPKKNGKTQLIAGLALYMLLCDNEPGAEVYVAAADREQARILFNAAKAMVEANPQLKKRCVVYRNKIERVDDPNAFFQVLSAEAATKHGPNIHCLIIDELHAQPDRELFETLTRGVIARRQPLILEITTAGDDDESICYEEYDYALRVLHDKIQDERHLPVIFEAKPDDDFTDRAVWARVNPGLGVTIDRTQFEGLAREAQNDPRKLNDFLRFNLNRWVNQAVAWIPTDWYDACKEPIASDAELAKLPVAGGLDLAQKIDLAAFVLTFRHPLTTTHTIDVVPGDPETEGPKAVDLNYRITILPFFWIPKDTMVEREKQDGVPYAEWARLKIVTPTDGSIIDYSRIYADITTKILPRFPKLRRGVIGYDPAFATDIAQQLRKFSGRKEWCLEVLQNYQHLSESCYVMEALIKAGRVSHGGHRVLRNHFGNVAVKMDDARRIRPVKPKQSGKHIDGVVASLMGLKIVSGLPGARAGVGVMVV